MEIEVNVRKLKLHILFIVAVVLLATGFLTWRIYRWDQPWLAPLKGYDMIVVRFDGLNCKDSEFAQLRRAFCVPLTRTDPGSPNLFGFRPSDFSYDEREWPSRYAWVQMIGYVKPSEREGALRNIRREVDTEIRKTGLKVVWRMALITRDGSVFYSD